MSMKTCLKLLVAGSAVLGLADSCFAVPVPIYNYSGTLGPGASVAVSATPDVDLTGARTITAWVDIPANTQTLGQPIAAGGTGAYDADIFGIAGANQAVGYPLSGTVPQYSLYVDHWGTPAYYSTTTVTPGQNVFVAMVYNGSSITFYIDGMSAGTVSGSLDSYDLDSYTIGGIGASLSGETTTESTDVGDLSDISIYNSALSESDIESLDTLPTPDQASTAALLGLTLAGLFAVRRKFAAAS